VTRRLIPLLKRIVPPRYRATLRWHLVPLLYRGDKVECPCCEGRFRKFLPGAWPNSVCPRCGCLKRHRELWVLLRDRLDVVEGDCTILHFAPESILQKRLKALPNVRYVSADLDARDAMLRFDITNIPFPDASFDHVLCSHVLEHVPEDRAAMREIFRMLRRGGRAVVCVPIDHNRAATYEEPAITSPKEREQAFGQRDHVRIYGRDFQARLEDAGFSVTLDRHARELEESGDPDFERYGFSGHENIYVCTKTALLSD
jgi:SAM-dependent methyltransferase